MMNSLPERVKAVGAERAALLGRLAAVANSAHTSARGAAGAAVAHIIASGQALAQARDLCGDGEWSAWVRANFHGSLRTAQRYVAAARCWPERVTDATCVSRPSQRRALGAVRGLLFSPPRRRSPDAWIGTLDLGDVPLGAADGYGRNGARPRCATYAEFVLLAATRVRAVADELSAASPEADDSAASLTARLRNLADSLALDTSGDGAPGSRVYFIEALGADRVKIGAAADPAARLAQLQTGSSQRLHLLGSIVGGRDVERALHARFAAFRLAGEWFHLSGALRASIRVLTDHAEVPGAERGSAVDRGSQGGGMA